MKGRALKRPQSPQRARLLVLVLGVLGAAALLAPAARAIDPFYEDLERDGRLAAARGETAQAARLLRLACFGMLEEPLELAPCLTHLALVQAELSDEEAFRATFDRLLEVEQRFTAYRRGEIHPTERERLRAAVMRFVPERIWNRFPAFAPPKAREGENGAP